MLIDTRIPDEPERPAWEPNWRLWRWVALTIAALAGASAVTGVASYALACATFGCACRALCVALPSFDGLREYRQ